METVYRIKRILSIVVFVSGVVLYLLFSAAHPFLHNHPIDGEHHHNCPACNFVATASFSIIPEGVIFPSISFQVVCLFLTDYQEAYQESFRKSYSVRGPPIISA